MNQFSRATLGAAISLALVYFIIAFVIADAWWVRDIWSWTRGERIMFLYGFLCAVTPGAAIGGMVS